MQILKAENLGFNPRPREEATNSEISTLGISKFQSTPP